MRASRPVKGCFLAGHRIDRPEQSNDGQPLKHLLVATKGAFYFTIIFTFYI
jgi:hypothetical protein